MSRPGQDKGPGRGSKGRPRGRPRGCPRGRLTRRPGIVDSWEDFSGEAWQEYLAAVVADLSDELDELEDALRSTN